MDEGKERRVLYYYTSAETMKYILSNGNIYATNMKYMNDSHEFLNGLTELRNLLIKEESQFRDSAKRKLTQEVYEDNLNSEVNSFSVSFTTASDLLSQWTMYARESGISLKMEFESGQYSFEAINPENNEKSLDFLLAPKKVFYFTQESMSPEDYGAMGKEIISAIEEDFTQKDVVDLDDIIIPAWIKTAPFIKRADFGAEAEYRLVFNFDNTEHFTPRVDFRVDKNVLKPYLDISLAKGWPITEITVGPGFNQESVFNSVAYYMSKGKVLVPPIAKDELSTRIKQYFDSMPLDSPSNGLADDWDGVFKDFCINNTADDQDTLGMLHNKYVTFIKVKGKEMNQPEVKEYIANNILFANGIVLKKSKIPYIY